MVRALWLAADRCESGEVYNVGSTAIYSVEELICEIQSLVKVPFQIQQEPTLMRACDEPVIAGNVIKFQRCTGWKPEIDLGRTLQDMLQWWRGRLNIMAS
jgi:nucleoside-diphosphate-sugar epimerase